MGYTDSLIKLEEEWLDDEHKMFITDSPYEVKNYFRSADHMLRLLYDQTMDYYMVGDGYTYIHPNILKAAGANGYYDFKHGFFSANPMTKILNAPTTVFASYFPKSSPAVADYAQLIDHVLADQYTVEYEYPDAYVFVQEQPGRLRFADTELASLLGEYSCKAIAKGYRIS